MPIGACKVCRSNFYIKPSFLKRGWGKYCSLSCKRNGQKSGRTVDCFICRKVIYRSKKDLKSSKSGKYFCSKSCQTLWRNSVIFIGPNHSNWKGGHKTYRDRLLRHSTPQICKRCELKDLRLLAAHHIDLNRNNNSINNLVWLCHNCHYLIHHDNLEREKLMEVLV